MRPVNPNSVQLDGRSLGLPLPFAPHLPTAARSPRRTHAAEIYLLDHRELRQTLSGLAAALRERYLLEPDADPLREPLQP
jgi:hypothetical protein